MALSRQHPAYAVAVEGDDLLPGSLVALRAERIAEWLARDGREGWTVVGSSLGSQVAVELARRSPRIGRLVLAPPALDGSGPRPWRQLARMARASWHEPSATNLLVLRAWLTRPPVGHLRLLAEALRYPMLERLAGVRQPTLLVAGTRDALTPRAWIDQLEGLPPVVGALSIEGASHALPHAVPEALAAAVRAFLIEEGAT